MQILVDLAAQFDRKVAFVGRGMIENSRDRAAARLPADPGRRADPRQRRPRATRRRTCVCICTGSQGEPQAALPRIAIDDHRHVKLDPDDVVVFSARAIPGQREGDRPGDEPHRPARRRRRSTRAIKHVHVSGHGSEEELKLMLSLVRPRYFVPIHGEYRQLARHAADGRRVVVAGRPKVLLAENGDVIRFDDEGARIAGKVPAGRDPDRRHARAARSATKCCATGATWPGTAWSCRSWRSTSSPARSRRRRT